MGFVADGAPPRRPQASTKRTVIPAERRQSALFASITSDTLIDGRSRAMVVIYL